MGVAAALALGIALPAAASDAKYHNGAFCRVAFAAGGSNMAGAVNYEPDGTVKNTSTQLSMTLVCPILRDNVVNDDGWNSVEVGYFDKHDMQAISCTALSRSFDDTFAWSEGGMSIDTASGWSKVNMTFDDPLDDGVFYGFYFLRCVVPPRKTPQPASGIAYYRVEEP